MHGQKLQKLDFFKFFNVSNTTTTTTNQRYDFSVSVLTGGEGVISFLICFKNIASVQKRKVKSTQWFVIERSIHR